MLANLSLLLLFFNVSSCIFDYSVKNDPSTSTDPDTITTIESDTPSDSESATQTDTLVDTHSDSEIGTCPGGVELVSAIEFTDLVLTDVPGEEFIDSCPEGQAIVGFEGFLWDDVDRQVHGRLRAICGVPSIRRDGEQCVVEIGPGATLPDRGTSGTIEWTRMCPDDEVIMGFQAWTGHNVDIAVFRCAPLLITGDGGGYAITRGPFTDLSPVGTGDGHVNFQQDCPDDQIATTTKLVATNFLRGMALGCQRPSLLSSNDSN